VKRGKCIEECGKKRWISRVRGKNTAASLKVPGERRKNADYSLGAKRAYYRKKKWRDKFRGKRKKKEGA